MAKILAPAFIVAILLLAVPLTAVGQQQGAPVMAPASTPSTIATMSPVSATADDTAAPSTTTIDTAVLPPDLSPWGMFQHADIVVQVVMVGLAFASVVTWTIFLAKVLQLLSFHRQIRVSLQRLEEAASLAAAKAGLLLHPGLAQRLLAAAEAEIDLSGDSAADGIKERVASRIERVAAVMGRSMTRGTGILATIGATAPFVGLFGTVWGIMNSFIGIATAHTTNLAVVAPGIAEALLATAFGLVAAIPAVVVYNLLARGIMANKAMLADMAAAILRLVSRDLDRVSVALSRAA